VKPRVCVVLKRSSWRKWVEEEKDLRITRLLDAGDETVRRMRPGHEDHTATVDEVRHALADLGAEVTWSDRPHGFRVEGRCDLVVTVGGDGTLLAASHGIGSGTPLLGINSSPVNSVGFFCAARKGLAGAALAAALDGTLRRVELSRMRVELNGGVLHDRILNEALFCHASPAATSRYILKVLGERGRLACEEQKSSGLWVGPAAGSTAAQKSAGGKVLPLSSRKLQFVVREPYQGSGHELAMTLGLIEEAQELAIKSKMRQARLFLDGDHIAHEVTIGDVVTLRRSEEPLVVLGLSRNGEAGGRPSSTTGQTARGRRSA
jgi:NAD+ kinase